jgi:hypothetical protein
VFWVSSEAYKSAHPSESFESAHRGESVQVPFFVQNHLKEWTFSRFVRECTVERNPLPAISVQNRSVCWITVRIIRELRWSESL